MKCLFLSWPVLHIVFHCITYQGGHSKNNGKTWTTIDKKNYGDPKPSSATINTRNLCSSGFQTARNAMEIMTGTLRIENRNNVVKGIQELERILERADVCETTPMSVGGLVALLYKPKGPFKGLKIQANDTMVHADVSVQSSKVSIHLPRELDVGSNNTIVFCMLTWPNPNGTAGEDKLYEDTLVGLSVRGKNIYSLQQPVIITMNLSSEINKTLTPVCVYLNFSTLDYSRDGCITEWKHDDSHIICNCYHLTYFGVLMTLNPPPPEQQEILTYISLIGCSLSLFALVLTVALFIVKRKVRTDVSMKVHFNLTIALILLNVYFLLGYIVEAPSSTGLCLYMALSLHYSLLATFTWMALEGFHLYLLLVKVFNIYIRRYILKLSLVGWGVPAVIVSLVVIIDRHSYGLVPLNSFNSKSTAICYIVNDTVKMITTVGVFSLVFVFNISMLGVTVRRLRTHKSKEFGQRNCNRAKQDICSLLGITTLLGITWGLVFFSFGQLTNAALYPFSILNSLQGFFIFLWFVMSMRKSGNAADPKTNSVTRSTNS